MLGGAEILLLNAVIGGFMGIYFRNKTNTTLFVGVVLGSLGGLITSYILVEFLFESIFAIPIYAIIGSWFFNFIWFKIK